MKARAAIGAAASFGDLVSDVYVAYAYYKEGRAGTANALLGMVGANIGFQLVIVYSQTHKLKNDKWKTMLYEFLSVVSFMKPGESHSTPSRPFPPF